MSAPAGDDRFEFDSFFHEHYARIARAVARVVGDRARAEELAVEAFWKLWRSPESHGDAAGGWVYRTAVRLALNELRARERRKRYEFLAWRGQKPATPEELHRASQEQAQVRTVLASLDKRQAELLALRSGGLSYQEVATAAGVNAASVGTLLSRAQQAFRKEYVRRYGQ